MRAGAGVIAAVALALPAAAQAETSQVDMFGSAFTPASVTVVAGDAVSWRNGDIVVHDIKGPGFASGIVARFGSFEQRFDAPGTQAYVCSLHLGMTGQVHVLAAKLTAPARAAIAGEPVALKGRTAPGTAAVTIERRQGGAWRSAGTVAPRADGTFTAAVTAAESYRARTAAGESPAVSQTVVAAPKVTLRADGGRLKVTTSPARTGLVARVEARRPAGWRRVAAKRLDARGRASLAVQVQGRVRVVLARDASGTALATSRAVRL